MGEGRKRENHRRWQGCEGKGRKQSLATLSGTISYVLQAPLRKINSSPPLPTLLLGECPFFRPVFLHHSRTTFSYIASAARYERRISAILPRSRATLFSPSFPRPKRANLLLSPGISYIEVIRVCGYMSATHTYFETHSSRGTLRLFIKKLLAILDCPREELGLFRDGRTLALTATWSCPL